MTYNVHSCIGSDGKADTKRIAQVIADEAPDVVALQELDSGMSRTHHLHQAEVIADILCMQFHFQPCFQRAEGHYGNAVLSRYPLKLIKGDELPGVPGKRTEKRGAMWVEMTVDEHIVALINTHFGLSHHERSLQSDAILGPDWLAAEGFQAPFIVCGDFNSIHGFSAHRILSGRLNDVQAGLRKKKTWPSVYPVMGIDHIFVSPGWEVERVHVPRSSLTRRASDHAPLIAELTLTDGHETDTESTP